jgi:cysteine desulfurase
VNGNEVRRIYLDYAATTQMRTEVIEAMQAALGDAAFNPSSLHAEGRRARTLLDRCRDRVAAVLGATRNEITFTGSGTEADNLALIGVAHALRDRGHVVVGATEHHAVVHAADALRDAGYETTVLPVDERGLVDVAEFEAALRPGTLLASIMYANNEIGTVAPIAELATIARRHGVQFHTDAVQAAGWLPIRVDELGVDLLTISAHKFHGPKGAGVLYARRGTPMVPMVHGGGQEFGRRSGTENVYGIAGLATALELIEAERPVRVHRVAALRDRLEAGIISRIDGTSINGAGAPRLPHITNISFEGVESDALLLRLDLEGIAVSAGSACASGALEPSHVIAALGLPRSRQTGVIRLSLGNPTTPAEIDRVLAVIPGIVSDLRRAAATPA